MDMVRGRGKNVEPVDGDVHVRRSAIPAGICDVTGLQSLSQALGVDRIMPILESCVGNLRVENRSMRPAVSRP